MEAPSNTTVAVVEDDNMSMYASEVSPLTESILRFLSHFSLVLRVKVLHR